MKIYWQVTLGGKREFRALMNLQEAIAAVQGSGLENASVVADFIRTQGGDLSSAQENLNSITQERDRLADNNATLLGQKRRATTERDEWKEKFLGIARQFTEEGDDEDAVAKRMDDLKAEVEDLRAGKATAEEERDNAIAETGKLQGEVSLRDVSQHLNVSAVLLKRLLPDVEPTAYVIDGDDVFVNIKGDNDDVAKKPWSEVLEAQPPEIQNALSGSQEPSGDDDNTTTNRRKAPTAPPSSPPKSKAKGVNGSLTRMGFGGPGVAAKKSSD